MRTSEHSITPHMIFWILNYTTWELLDPQLHHMETSEHSKKSPCGVIEGSELAMWCN
jgi:hypothetical protein